MGSYGFRRSRCHEQMISNAFQAWMYMTDDGRKDLKAADSRHYCDLSNHLVILSHFPSTNNNRNLRLPEKSTGTLWSTGPSPTRHESFLRRKARVAFLEGGFALVRSSSIPVDKTIDAAHKEVNRVCLFLEIWSLLCVCVMHIIVCASHRNTHTCMWKERTSLDGWNQDVCKGSGGDKQRSKHTTTTTTGRDKHTTTNAEISHCEL